MAKLVILLLVCWGLTYALRVTTTPSVEGVPSEITEQAHAAFYEVYELISSLLIGRNPVEITLVAIAAMAVLIGLLYIRQNPFVTIVSCVLAFIIFSNARPAAEYVKKNPNFLSLEIKPDLATAGRLSSQMQQRKENRDPFSTNVTLYNSSSGELVYDNMGRSWKRVLYRIKPPDALRVSYGEALNPSVHLDPTTKWHVTLIIRDGKDETIILERGEQLSIQRSKVMRNRQYITALVLQPLASDAVFRWVQFDLPL